MVKTDDESNKEHPQQSRWSPLQVTSDEARAELKDRILSTIRGSGSQEWTVEMLMTATNCGDEEEVKFCAYDLARDGSITELRHLTPEQIKEREELQKASGRLKQYLEAPLRVVVVSSAAPGPASPASTRDPNREPVPVPASVPAATSAPDFDLAKFFQARAKDLHKAGRYVARTSLLGLARMLVEELQRQKDASPNRDIPTRSVDYLRRRSVLEKFKVWPLSRIVEDLKEEAANAPTSKGPTPASVMHTKIRELVVNSPGTSDEAIAFECGVDAGTVAKVRSQIQSALDMSKTRHRRD
jgi:hypothetical protein